MGFSFQSETYDFSSLMDNLPVVLAVRLVGSSTFLFPKPPNRPFFRIKDSKIQHLYYPGNEFFGFHVESWGRFASILIQQTIWQEKE